MAERFIDHRCGDVEMGAGADAAVHHRQHHAALVQFGDHLVAGHARAVRLESRFRERLAAIQQQCPIVKEIRARGVMIGIELTIDGTPIVQRCIERGLLINCTHTTVLRLLPALNLTDAELDEGAAILEEVILQLSK